MITFSLGRTLILILAQTAFGDEISTSSSSRSSSYPKNALECYASASPRGHIICPKDRNDFCVKEVVSSQRSFCGKSIDHPFDQWDIKEPGGLCVYKKCASAEYCSTSTNRTLTFNNNGKNHTRYTLCCSDNLCNSANLLYRIGVGSILTVITAFTLFI